MMRVLEIVVGAALVAAVIGGSYYGGATFWVGLAVGAFLATALLSVFSDKVQLAGQFIATMNEETWKRVEKTKHCKKCGEELERQGNS